MTQSDIKHEPLYLDISRNWFEKARRVKKAEFYKFFCLWSSFNALYNLVGDWDAEDNKRIETLIGRLSEEDAASLIRGTKKSCDYFMLERGPIQDMKKKLFGRSQPDDVRNFGPIKRKYLNPDVPNKTKLRYITAILYRIRNNLTHGSKGVSGMDREVISHAIPILEKLVRTIGNCVFELDLK